jgi:leukotriene-A4 hydrolase
MKPILYLLCIGLLTASCQSMFVKNAISGEFKEKRYDESTFSNINEYEVEHYNLTLDFNFTSRTITGEIRLFVNPLTTRNPNFILDIWDLNVTKVSEFGGDNLDFVVTDPNPNLGKALNITMPTNSPKKQSIIQIFYKTQSNIAGSWLLPEQTAGKKLEYYFTQCQSIYCRNIAPLQDTPAIKSTYHLDIITEPEYVARASGNLTQE